MTARKQPSNPTEPYEDATSRRSTRLERAVAEVMKAQEGPELLAKITSREFKDAFQAIAVQQRGTINSMHFDINAVPVVQINYDPDFPNDKSKQLYHCRIGAGVLTPETARSLQAEAARRDMRLSATPTNEFNNDHWFKAILITIYAHDLKAIIALVNDELIEKVRADARVTYDDVMAIAQEEIGKLF